MPNHLPGALSEQLFKAVLGAYSKDDLQRVVWFNLDTDLSHVVADGSLAAIVFGLIRHLDRLGGMDKFLAAVAKDRPQNRDLEQAIQAIRRGTTHTAGAAPGEPATDDLHPLRRFPPGPLVPFDWIPRSLVSQFADHFYDKEEIQRAVLDAIRERLASDPGAKTIRLPGLLNPGRVDAISFWGDAFVRACPHGPRMVAALILLIPEELFPVGPRAERSRLLQDLAAIR
jgi:hypothetical protein